MQGQIALKYVVIIAIVCSAATGIAVWRFAKPKVPAEIETIEIGVLTDLTGPVSTIGKDVRNSLLLAKDDIDTYFRKEGLPYKVEYYVEDTKIDPTRALSKMTSLNGRGIKMYVGPLGSGCVKNVLGYVNAHKLITISPASTAIPELIGVTSPEEKKYLFRFVAHDAFQTTAIAAELEDLGIKGVVIANIGNPWGKGLVEQGRPKFEDRGIEVQTVVEYPDPPPADFSPFIAELEEGISSLLDKGYKYEEIGVVAFSYDEAATMLSQVREGSDMLKVTWVGCDGTKEAEAFLGKLLPRSSEVKMYSTGFESKGPAYEEFKTAYRDRFGAAPRVYGPIAYDCAWPIALAYAKVGEYDADKIAELIPKITEEYSKERGVTGAIILNEFNDRASGDYAITRVTEEGWEKVGMWRYETGEIEWLK